MEGADLERSTAAGSRPARDRAHERPAYLQVKTYVILRRVLRRGRDGPNVEVLDVKLNLAAAQEIVDAYAGSWLVRVMADKRSILTKRD